MKIHLLWPWELPKKLSGICVVIDVNAATTNIPLLLCQQIRILYIVNDENVITLKNKYKNSLVIGESLKLPQDFFNCSNFPAEISKLEVTGKTVLYMSNNGSKVIEKVFQLGANTVITASFANIQVIHQWLLSKANPTIYLIPAGERIFADKKCEEDFLLAEALKNLLNRKPFAINEYCKKAKDFVQTHYEMPNIPENLKIEFTLNRYPIIPKCFWNNKEYITVRG